MSYDKLQDLAKLIRYYILLSTTRAKSGHPTTSLSATDLMTVLFFKYLRFDLKNPDNLANDRLIFSKGHGSPLLYALYGAAGVVSKKELENLRKFDSTLEGHPTPRFKYTEAATGSLGQGLSVGFGMALGLEMLAGRVPASDVHAEVANENFDTSSIRLLSDKNFKSVSKRSRKRHVFHKRSGAHFSETSQNFIGSLPTIYVLLGDGEMAEGSVWEAIALAAHYKLNNLVGILDVNRLAQSGETIYGHNVGEYEKRIKAFGWETIVIDGHDFDEIDMALSSVNPKSEIQNNTYNSEKPTMIIAKTIKGKGVSFIEDKPGFHGKPLSEEDFKKAVGELGKVDLKIKGKVTKPTIMFRHSDPVKAGEEFHGILRSAQDDARYEEKNVSSVSTYKLGDSVATRKAYGEALAKLGNTHPNVVALDADTKNSTYSEIFQKKHPDRFFDMYIAEQNMVGAAVGMAKLGLVPFASTFACFLTRAFDQLRMAALSASNIKLVGSHAGVSIGADGPSQMGLEDFAMMRAVHGSVVLHPSDGVSTEKLTHEMIRHKGMVYMRTARPATPVIYDSKEKFKIGGSKVFESARNQRFANENFDVASVSLAKKSSPTRNRKRRSQSEAPQNFVDAASNRVTIVACGVTLHEALAAQEQLKQDGLAVRVIDCYCLKPIDKKTLKKCVKETKAIIVVEDHWFEGGLGDAVLNVFSDKPSIPIYKLAVTKMPRSGTGQELMRFEKIDAQSIVEKVWKIVKG